MKNCLPSELESVQNISNKNAGEIARLKGTIESLVSINKGQSNKLGKLVELVEDRTNRQLRNTLVFKGIPVTKGERHGMKEAWNETRKVLAETLAQHVLDLSVESAQNIFERVHRGRPIAKNVQNRHIYARVFDWNMSEKLKNDMRKVNTQNPSLKIYCEQMYGPRTSQRRNHALSIRKTLKSNNEIVSGYVSFPAKLMVKVSSDPKATYTIHDDYSEMEIDEALIDRSDDGSS